jgi:cysteine synthase A
MDFRDGFAASVGNTPLIKLRKRLRATGCTILGKAEFLNPGGSVKDRAALYIILDAEERGLLKPGGVIVEGTAGNTGIGLALVGNCARLPHRDRHPETAEPGKEGHAAALRRRAEEVPAVPYKDPNNYVHVSERLAKELAASEPNGALWANQWTTQRTAKATSAAPGRRSGGRRPAGSTASPARSEPAARSRAPRSS